ncbi:carbohydrate ABC transporter membrane protein 2 (CUT1 family) [Pseudonocardia cypriaca]|uniref:Carbohydrate ABC transporter membrane protein 2 (CUT1 family) n=2 Tax=Pseudonocardia cypriaca TaxID=882449 RepID=A0A543FQY7_9PSEU|nr:carbohydrate ABC transporter membrane protein 2 (CUT1 family) [Pseudonocardia cypriaca]
MAGMTLDRTPRPTPVRPRRTGASAGLVARYVVLVLVVLLSIFPLVWLLLTSLRTSDELFAVPVQLLPSTVTLDQYVTVFTEYEMADYVWNSIVVSLATVALVMVLALPCAYVLARFRLPGVKVLITVLLIMRMIPVIALAIPLFAVFSQIGLLDSVLGLVLTHAASKLPVAIWLLMAFIQDLPKEIEESAEIDGAGVVRKLVFVVAPLIGPGLAASAVLTFLFTWNDLLIALTLTSSEAAQTLPVGLTNFVTQFGIDWGPMSAAGVLMVVPTLLFVWFAQGYLVKGLVAGAVRG